MPVSQVTALGRTSTDVVERLADGTERRTHTGPTGASAETVIAPGGAQTTTYPDGAEVRTTSGPDPRFGMIVPRTTAIVTRTPSGLEKVVETMREVVLSNPSDPLSLESLVDTASINGRTFTSAYQASTRQLTTTSAEGRPSTTTFDVLGRPVSVQVGTLLPVVLAYDGAGRLISRSQGVRTWSFGYDPTRGVMVSSTDPLLQTVGLMSDAVGRVTTQTLPDARTIGIAYDAAGNTTAVTPPGRPAHAFAYDLLDREVTYEAPSLCAAVFQTTRTFDADGAPTSMTLADQRVVSFAHDRPPASSPASPGPTLR